MAKFESKISQNNQILECPENLSPSVCPESKSSLILSEKLEEIESVEVFEIDQIKIGVEFACI